jgi:hypothetical protein
MDPRLNPSVVSISLPVVRCLEGQWLYRTHDSNQTDRNKGQAVRNGHPDGILNFA